MLTSLIQVRDTDRFGSKAARLGEGLRLGWPVPCGFAIPDRVLQSHLQTASLVEAILRCGADLPYLTPQEVSDTGTRLRERISSMSLQPSLRRALKHLLDGSGSARVFAVRSSAVGEDSVDASFAGQLESFLNIRTLAALETAILASWASLWSPRALLYAQHSGMRPGRMGVIIQEQVDARYSGVLFTRDPCDRDRDAIVVEYCAGLGDRLVGGAVNPDRFLISRNDLRPRAWSPEESRLALDECDVAAIVKLAEVSLAAEVRFGAAQDVEWCIDREHRPFVLQVRPITTPQAAVALRARVAYWSNANISENYPRPVSPLLYSIVRPAYAAYFGGVATALGLPASALQSRSRELANLVGLQGGRLYYNVSHMHAVQQLMPGSARLHRYLNAFVGTENVPPPPTPARSFWGNLARQLRVAACTTWQYAGIEWRIRRFERRVDRFARDSHPRLLDGKSPQALADCLRGFLDIRMRRWGDAALADNAAMMCYGLLKDRLVGDRVDDPESTLHNALLTGLPGLASTAPVRELWKLSCLIREDPTLASLFSSANCEAIQRALDEPAHARLREALERYIDEWGFRFSEELMLTSPTPRENPLPVIRLLQAYVKEQAPDPEAKIRSQARMRKEETRKLIRTLGAGVQFRLLLWATHAAIRYRERARMKQALLYTRLRHIALCIGERLAERKLIDGRDDVFMLTTGEALKALCEPDASTRNLRERIATRRRELERAATFRPPDYMVLPDGVNWQPPTTPAPASNGHAANACLSGLGASSGRATGEAVVLMEVAEAGQLRAGQILVTGQTDPGWAAVFYLAGGLVVERGGILSHGAIIAREYGIPAVVGVADATRLIPSGTTVEVDGSGGRVHLHGR